MSSALSESEVAQMEAALAEHYGQPVRPVSEYCDALRTWVQAVMDNHPEGVPDGMEYVAKALRENWLVIDLAIRKSSLLARMIYGGEEIRTEQCPEHRGTWCGIGRCHYGCDYTGWLPKEAESVPS